MIDRQAALHQPDFPLDFHAQAMPGRARALRPASRGKFWEMRLG